MAVSFLTAFCLVIVIPLFYTPVESHAYESGQITATTARNISEYFFNVALSDIPSDIIITKIEARDPIHFWMNGQRQDWCTNCYSFDGSGASFRGPFDFRLTVNNDTNHTKITEDVFTHMSDIKQQAVIGYIDYETGDEHEHDDDSGLSSGGVAAIIIIVVLAVILIIVGVCWCSRNEKRQGRATFDETVGDNTVQMN